MFEAFLIKTPFRRCNLELLHSSNVRSQLIEAKADHCFGILQIKALFLMEMIKRKGIDEKPLFFCNSLVDQRNNPLQFGIGIKQLIKTNSLPCGQIEIDVVIGGHTMCAAGVGIVDDSNTQKASLVQFYLKVHNSFIRIGSVFLVI